MPIPISKVVVALSGGVDSSLAAALLKQQGYQVSGLHFLLPAAQEKIEARRQSVTKVAETLEIPLAFINLQDAFTRLVIQPFIKAYLTGLTPNPCVECNVLIKFEHLLQYANKHDIDYIATGHYATVTHGRKAMPELRRGRDRGKDQSYFLHRLNQTQLARTLFPLSAFTKTETKELARKLGLPTYREPESQEICFLPHNDYRRYLEAQMNPKQIIPGDILDQEGRILGTHEGTYRYTIGQRHGLGIASKRPYYVKEIKSDSHQVIVGGKEEIYSSVVEAEDFHWLLQDPDQQSMSLKAQIRYRHEAAGGRLEMLSQRRVRFTFDEPQWAVTPGQSLVCYQDEQVVGGGWIVKEKGLGKRMKDEE